MYERPRGPSDFEFWAGFLVGLFVAVCVVLMLVGLL